MALPGKQSRSISQTSDRTANKHQVDSRLKRLDHYANLLDSKFQIPGTSIRFGWDGIIGLIPGIGDFLTFAFSTGILVEAKVAGAPFALILRMLLNLLIEFILGSIPFIGDAFDVLWKANIKNVELLRKHLNQQAGLQFTPKQNLGRRLLYYTMALAVLSTLFYLMWMGSQALIAEMSGFLTE